MKDEHWIIKFINLSCSKIPCWLGFHVFTDDGEVGDDGLEWKRCERSYCKWFFNLKGDWYKFKGVP